MPAPDTRATSARHVDHLQLGELREPLLAEMLAGGLAAQLHETGYIAAGSFTGMARIGGPGFLLSSGLNRYRSGLSST